MKSRRIFIILSCCALLSAACSHEETVGTETAEPSEAPVFVSFEPGQAKAGDVLTITGAYFGTDPSRITVLINSTPVQIVSVSDNAISVIVPEECGSGEVRIGIRRGTEGELKLYETTFETLFTYTVESNVSTFAGRSGLTGQHYFGPYLTSCFYAPSQLVRDKEDNFYLAEWARGIRLLSNGETSWMLPMYGGGTPEQNQGGIATDAYSYDFRAIAFSNDCSRLWILVNRPQSRGAYLGYALKSDGYGLWYADSSDDQPDCEGLAVNPVDDRIFICRNHEGSTGIFVYDTDTHTLSQASGYTPLGVTCQSRPVFSKDGTRLYVIHKGRHCISAYDYDPETHRLSNEVHEFAGMNSDAGDYADGKGKEARFNYPEYGCCDDDGNLYVADSWNHCIRKITPDGTVTTFAGIPYPSTDGNNPSAFANGKPSEAVFSKPNGICMDSKGNLYVAEEGFADIRKIVIGNEQDSASGTAPDQEETNGQI